MDLDSLEKVRIIASTVRDKKAKDVTVLELKEISIITDYFVVCSGESTTQVRAIVDHIEERLRSQGFRPAGVEGYRNSQWILMDFGDVIVHVFEDETRKFYTIEKLWLDAPRIEI
ncbi:MAG TPA: ribosome silencing factor [Nitrospirae bacterium]|nr:ribosome silencing factor [Nitrospirota bacterium]HDY70623.1 ribosome silencing factor [Nitrospirota bacterium]